MTKAETDGNARNTYMIITKEDFTVAIILFQKS
jgi:hypothetical protein